MLPDSFLIYIVLAPGLAALTGLFHKWIGDRVVMAITTGVVMSAGALSLYQLFAYVAGLAGGAAPEHHAGFDAYLTAGTDVAAVELKQHIITLMPWIHVGDFQANWAIRVDTLSIVMMAVITGVSGLVHLYSWGYMSEDPHKARFFSYLSLFTFMMLMLVVASTC